MLRCLRYLARYTKNTTVTGGKVLWRPSTDGRTLIIRMTDAKNPDHISIACSDFDIFIHWNTPCHRISVKVTRSLPNRRHHILSSLNLLCHVNPLCYPVDNLIIGRTRCSEIRKPITNRSIEIIAPWLISDSRRSDWREYIVVFATIERKKNEKKNIDGASR